jgi:CRISPR-associated protein Cmr2
VGEALGAVNWVKRVAAHRSGRPGTPSTFSIASAPYRAEVLARLGEPQVRDALMALHSVGGALGQPERPVPGVYVPAGLVGDEASAAAWLARSAGPWVDPDRWQDSTVAEAVGSVGAGGGSARAVEVASGRRAARALQEAVGWASGTHLAIVLQDLDDMGRFLSGLVPAAGGQRCEVDPAAHAVVSRRLGEVAREQRRAATGRVDPLHGVPVYIGGDDLLMLAPAATAMRLASTVHDLVPGDLRTASTAVLFFSQQESLQQAIRRAHELLDAAKTQVDGKHALAVGYERRSGGAYRTVQPWCPASGAGIAEVFAGLAGGGAAGGGCLRVGV